VCYDGQYFFDTDHAEGDSGAQSNKIDVDISALPVSANGTPASPSAAAMSHMIAKGISQILSFRDDRGRPMNQSARAFQVQVPIAYMSAAALALSGEKLEGGDASVVANLPGFNVELAPNPELTWTDKIAVMRTDGRVKPFIRQEEVPVTMKAIAEGSELEFEQNEHHYGVEWQGAVGYGRWQHACLVAAV
jgi:phage major head subunit gpT-like protein